MKSYLVSSCRYVYIYVCTKLYDILKINISKEIYFKIEMTDIYHLEIIIKQAYIKVKILVIQNSLCQWESTDSSKIAISK